MIADLVIPGRVLEYTQFTADELLLELATSLLGMILLDSNIVI